MTKYKGQTMIYNTLHSKLKTDQHDPNSKTGGEHRCSGRVDSSCSTSGTCRVTFNRREHFILYGNSFGQQSMSIKAKNNLDKTRTLT